MMMATNQKATKPIQKQDKAHQSTTQHSTEKQQRETDEWLLACQMGLVKRNQKPLHLIDLTDDYDDDDS